MEECFRLTSVRWSRVFLHYVSEHMQSRINCLGPSNAFLERDMDQNQNVGLRNCGDGCYDRGRYVQFTKNPIGINKVR